MLTSGAARRPKDPHFGLRFVWAFGQFKADVEFGRIGPGSRPRCVGRCGGYTGSFGPGGISLK
jgi:hypothetical protein